ncbi:MAG: O-antigen ligase family protein [Candidatus Peribacteraceae bacterium]|jgi:O-antigen ligase
MKSRLLENLSRATLLILLVFGVLWRGGKGIESTWLLVAVAGLLTLATYFIKGGAQEGRGMPSVPWSSAMLFVAWTILSFLFSLTRNYGLDEVLRDGALILLLLWAARWMRNEKGEFHPFVNAFLNVVIILTFIACATGTAVYVFQPVNRLVGSFFYYRFSTDYWPNAWAEFLLLAWPVVLLWMTRAAEGRMKVMRAALLGWVLGCFFLSYSRGATVAFAGQLLLLAVFLPRGVKLRKALWPLLRTVIIAVSVALATFMAVNAVRVRFHPVISVAEKITFTADEGSSSFTERTAFFRQASLLAYMRPLFGWGPYSFRFAQPRLQETVLQTSDHPHNMLLKYAAERGVAAAFLFIILVGSILLPTGWRLLRQGKAREEGFTTSLLFVAVAGVLAHNLIDYNLQFVGIVMPLFFFLGLLAPTPRKPVKPRTQRLRRMAEILLATVILVVATAEFPFLVTSSLGRHAEVAGKTQEAQEWYARAANDIFPRDILLSRAILYMDVNASLDAERVVREYLRTNGEDARAWKLLGELQLKTFHASEAVDSFRQAYLLSRWNDVGVVRGYLQSLAEAGKGGEIGEQGGEILALMEAFATAIRNNTHFITLSGNVEQYVELSTLAERLFGAEGERIRGWVRTVEESAQETRLEFSSRRPGYLW